MAIQLSTGDIGMLHVTHSMPDSLLYGVVSCDGALDFLMASLWEASDWRLSSNRNSKAAFVAGMFRQHQSTLRSNWRLSCNSCEQQECKCMQHVGSRAHLTGRALSQAWQKSLTCGDRQERLEPPTARLALTHLSAIP